MRKIWILLICVFILMGCTNPMQDTEQTTLPIPTPNEETITPSVPTIPETQLSFEDIFLIYQVFIDAKMQEYAYQFDPYYPISNSQNVITKESLLATYNSLNHEVIELDFSNLYYLHLFHNLNGYVDGCNTNLETFSCVIPFYEGFVDVTADFVIDDKSISLEAHMYNDFDGNTYGYHRYYQFDIIDNLIHVEVVEIQTKKSNEEDANVILTIYAKMIEETSFEFFYKNIEQDKFIYTNIDIEDQIEVHFSSIEQSTAFYYYDKVASVKHQVSNPNQTNTEYLISYYVDNILVLVHSYSSSNHTLMYNLMTVDGWSQVTHKSDGSSLLSIDTNGGLVEVSTDMWLRLDEHSKIPLNLILSSNDLDSMDLELTSYHMEFSAFSKETITQNFENLINSIESTKQSYEFTNYDMPSIEHIESIWAQWTESATTLHNNN